MKISLFTGFGALNSNPVFAAARTGLEHLGHQVVEHDWTADAAVIWSVLWHGRMAPNQTVFEEFRRWGRPVIVLEVGCLNRGNLWRVSAFDEHGQHYPAPVSDARAGQLNVRYRQREQLGDHVLVVCQRTDSLQWAGGTDIVTWIQAVVNRVRVFSNRPIVVRPHPRQPIPGTIDGVRIERALHMDGSYDSFDFERALNRARVVINPTASPGVVSVLSGVPVIASPGSATQSLALPAGIGYDEIESGQCGARTQQWLSGIAHTEWTLHEIAAGLPFALLQAGRFQSNHT